ncbi:Methyltransferase domain family protein [Babesia bovis T2Bo]|uniref:Methyltransferase domain family protein n=1 Tax=Babesia bovis T2Bo TaxID=484906 RepID=UPI001D2CD62F|nr:Methyltransferase domain family protein [Babesia bovis T2Bo]EDO05837.2 Methyltransferase domain family protein [Babesia bovis T2Bo]
MSVRDIFTFGRVCTSLAALNGAFIYVQYRKLVVCRPEYKQEGLPEEKHRIAIFDNIAPTYDLTYGNTHRKLGITAAKANILKRAKGHVLDLAAGTLENYKLYSNITSLTALDKSVMMCLEMKRKIESEKPDFPVTIVCADASAIPFENESFSTVVTTHGLCSVEHPGKCLDEVARVLKPSGRYIGIERGRVYYRPLRALLNWLKLYPNPGMPWKYGYFEDRDPIGLVQNCKGLTMLDSAVFGYGMNYSILARRFDSDKKSEFSNEPRIRPEARVIYSYVPRES